MKIWKIAAIVALATVAGTLLIASVYAYMGGYGGMMNRYGGMMGGNRDMMGGYGYYNYPPTSTQTQPGTTTLPTTGSCPHQYGEPYSTPGTTITAPINITTANTIAQNYLTSLNNPDLTIAQVEEYTQNFYVQIRETSTGSGAFELTINKYTGAIYPEMGPNMMWNTKYRSANTAGMMGGMMNGYTPYAGTPTTTMTVTVTQATTNAQQFFNSYLSGATTGDVTAFYGYYTIEVFNGGTTYGMLSVNGYTGQVWYHTWHGTFVQEVKLS